VALEQPIDVACAGGLVGQGGDDGVENLVAHRAGG
jgi:hypothetical protein